MWTANSLNVSWQCHLFELDPLELVQPGTTDSCCFFFFFFFPEWIHTAFLPYHSQLGWLAKEKTGAHKQLRIWVQKPWCPDPFVHQCTDLHKALVALPSAASELNVSQTQHKHSSQNKITFSSQAWVITQKAIKGNCLCCVKHYVVNVITKLQCPQLLARRKRRALSICLLTQLFSFFRTLKLHSPVTQSIKVLFQTWSKQLRIYDDSLNLDLKNKLKPNPPYVAE